MQESNYKTILLGYSGHGVVVAEAALLSGVLLSGYTDKQVLANNPFNLNYLGDEHSSDFEYWANENKFVLGIGDNKTRTEVADYINGKGFDLLTIIHPQSSISKLTELGSGIFIARNVAINPLTILGNNIIINTSASIDHECNIGDGSHIAPGAVLAGSVTVGKQSLIGANAVIKQGVQIGNNVVIGAGAVVLNNVDSNSMVVGNPAISR